ncbi:putative prephenate dehydratase, signal recognition particle, SRP54 subunit [Plasmopara halstedii]
MTLANVMRANVMRLAAIRTVHSNQFKIAQCAISYPQSSMQLRSMGLLSNIKKTVSGKLEERNQHKQGEAYKQQMIELSQQEKFDLNGFYAHLKKNAEASGASGWRAMIPGVSSMTAVQQMKMFMTILESMEPEYLESPRLINGKVKRKISEKTGHSPEDINNMLRNYEQLSALHIWLVKRAERGLSIPETIDETTEMVRQDPTGFPAKKFRGFAIHSCKFKVNTMQSSHNVVFGDPLKPVKLDDFRNVLIRQEETIIFALIERAQFPRNMEVYLSMKDSKSAAFGGLKGKYTTFDGSLLDFMLLETEKLHALTRRYTSPDENAFFPHHLPEPILPLLNYPRVLNPNRINVNHQIMSVYLEKILPGLTTFATDDTAFGSTATADIAVLQALSKRIHFGKFIAEAKFQAETERYTELILANDADGIMKALTNLEVEKKVLERVKMKASAYGQDPNVPISTDKTMKVSPQLISDLYCDFVMPLTKEVQVQYLLQRVTHPTIAIAGTKGSFCWLAAQTHFGSNTLNDFQLYQAESISQVFENVNANCTAYGVVPIEDSLSGMIKETQAQLRLSTLKVSAEILLTRSFLFATQDKRLLNTNEVTKVFCPLETSACFLAQAEQNWPSAQMISVSNVSEAASCARSEALTVAVTTAGAADSNNLDQIESSYELTSDDAVTSKSFIRFVIVSKGYPAATGKDKSFLSMEIKHEVGSLLSALDVWKKHNINLSWLESLYRKEGGYDFFVEIVGHYDDKNVQQAVQDLQSVCTLKHLGSFPTAERLIRS